MSLGDNSSEEELFDAIKTFQSTFATHPDLIPGGGYMVFISARRSNINLKADVVPEREDNQDDPVAIHAEVRTTELMPDCRNQHSVPYRKTIELPRTTRTI
jgi:hypothetical protein